MDFSELTLKVKKNTEAGSIIILYAAGEKLGKNTLYAMVQCVSLTIDCKSCLAWSITKLFKNGDIREGGRVLGIYNSGSEYEDSLNILFRKVRTDDYARTGFMHLTKGPASDSVTVMFQCRGDSYGSKCRTCADTAVAGVNELS
ncbi:hypothetical protein Bca52824_048875 [Brassica carinata]|uniref:Gnk2-homologous domain-containing protein n=1 Tax=Brassica carinata TaxID=52824 RepID=A0A8X7RJ65_BRACI|nr:hypothetical protein Bca52824_048875 [Brassica carinata]